MRTTTFSARAGVGVLAAALVAAFAAGCASGQQQAGGGGAAPAAPVKVAVVYSKTGLLSA